MIEPYIIYYVAFACINVFFKVPAWALDNLNLTIVKFDQKHVNKRFMLVKYNIRPVNIFYALSTLISLTLCWHKVCPNHHFYPP